MLPESSFYKHVSGICKECFKQYQHNRRRAGIGKAAPEYTAYVSAKNRCTNPRMPQYEWYGGRGIKFLFTSFEHFLSELGLRPSAEHTLERINNDGNYEPGNVRWATWEEQAANRRKPVRSVTIFDSSMEVSG